MNWRSRSSRAAMLPMSTRSDDVNGPEHYREAERLLEINAGHPDVSAGMDRVIAAAQVHATLALAAAQVEDMESTELRAGWAEIVEEGES